MLLLETTGKKFNTKGLYMSFLFKLIQIICIYLLFIIQANAQIKPLKIWSRNSIGINGAIYGILKSPQSDKLLNLKSSICQYIELHTNINDGFIKRMRKIKSINMMNNNKNIILKPGGIHIMLMKLKINLIKGDKIPLIFEFNNLNIIKVIVPIKQ